MHICNCKYSNVLKKTYMYHRTPSTRSHLPLLLHHQNKACMLACLHAVAHIICKHSAARINVLPGAACNVHGYMYMSSRRTASWASALQYAEARCKPAALSWKQMTLRFAFTERRSGPCFAVLFATGVGGKSRTAGASGC